VNAVVAGGVVHLWGAAQSEDERRAARIAAERTPGVKRVVDNLGVFPPTARATLWAE
jgi:osmotically-inducible protein OsmY